MKRLFGWYCLLLSCVGFAGTMSDPSVHHGFYLGGSVGYDYAKIYDQYQFNYTTSHGPSTMDGHLNTALSGFVGGGFIGYGRMLNPLIYLGVEVFGNGSTASGNDYSIYQHFHDEVGLFDGDGFSNNMSLKNNFGVSLLPGIEINQKSLYAALCQAFVGALLFGETSRA